jgi:hypothetical protein
MDDIAIYQREYCVNCFCKPVMYYFLFYQVKQKGWLCNYSVRMILLNKEDSRYLVQI